MKICTKLLCDLSPHKKKFLLVMKITTLLLFVSIMQVCASGFAQKVTLTKKNVSLKEIFREIRKQTNYNIFYSDKKINDNKRFDVDFKHAPLEEVLKQSFRGLDLKFSIEDKTIYIKQEALSFLDRIINQYNTVDLRGQVVDTDGRPLPGASVKVKGRNTMTTSDGNGHFSLNGFTDDAVLVISYIGYSTVEIPYAKLLSLSSEGRLSLGEAKITRLGTDGFVFHLSRIDNQLQEVIVNKGYYTEKKKLSTGAVSSISAKEIAKQSVSNPLLALKSRMAGVDVVESTGIAGGAVSIRIRGTNSLRPEGNEPLYVVNGVPFSATSMTTGGYGGVISGASPLSDINPEDIESIDILKDGDATAIYGSRGANGVVLITTKKGKSGETKFDFKYSRGEGDVPRFAHLLNTQQYIAMRKEAYANDGIPFPTSPGFDDSDITHFDTTRYTDWQKELIGGTATYDKYGLSMSGGSGKTTFLLGLSHTKEGNVFPKEFFMQRSSVNLNISQLAAKDRLRVDLTANYNYRNNNLPYRDVTSFTISLQPNAPAAYLDNGQLNFDQGLFSNNPYAQLENPFSSATKTLITNAQVSYQLLKGIEVKLNAGFNNNLINEITKMPSRFTPNPTTTPDAGLTNVSELNRWTIEPSLAYSRNLGPGFFKALMGVTKQYEKMDGSALYTSGYLHESLIGNAMAASRIIVDASPFYEYKYAAAYALLNYNLYDKYVISLTGNRNASSRFGPDKRVANFYSVAGAWIFSGENVFKDSPVLSFGKLKGSYGRTGNDQIPNYGYVDSYSSTSNSYNSIPTITPTRLANADFSWESTTKMDIGLELGFFNNRISTESTFYRGISTNQLVGYALPATTGFNNIQFNLPATIRNLSWEFTLRTKNIGRPHFSWNSSLMWTVPKNKLLKYPNLASSSYSNTFTVGMPVTVEKKIRTLGVDPQTGMYKFFDANSNGSDLEYPGDLDVYKFLGRKGFGSIANEFNYRNFNFSFVFQFVKQNNYLYSYQLYDPPGMGTTNQFTEVLKRWRNPGDVAPIQKFTTGGDVQTRYSYYSQLGDQVIGDASFIRLQNLALYYTLNKGLLEKIRIRSARVFFLGQNLLTITNSVTADPEVQSSYQLPVLRVLTAGIEIGF